MLHEFAVENFLSFKSQQILSFEASSDKTYEDFCVVQKNNIRLLKLALVYGANASGKTNLMIALDFLRDVVLETQEDKNETTGTTPFLLSKKSRKMPTRFRISFFVGPTRYIYELVLNSELIINERLVFYPKSQPALLFERIFSEKEKISRVVFGEKTEFSNKEKIVLEGNTINNQTVLASYLISNVFSKSLDEALHWFSDGLLGLISPNTRLMEWTGERIAKDSEKQRFSIDALKFADFNISDILIKKRKEKFPDEFINSLRDDHNIPEKEIKKLIKESGGEIELKEIFFKHKTSEGEYSLPFSVQSKGTQRYFGLTGPLNKLIEDNTVIPIDEIESSLHHDLVSTFLKTFLVNSGESQIICSTHDIQLLEEDFIRRDIIWFCEKKESGETELYPLSAFKLHKNRSILNAYKIGKFGAKPDPSNIYLN